MTILYIILFIVCLSTLIAVHELGHLATAKIFKVYCFEYALGFGPKIFSKKRKNGETYFSLRAIPFGGFVSMYGESDTVPEGLEIDPSRSLLAIKKWKRAIIMAAGVIMNFILALAIFFVYEVAFPMYSARYAHVVIKKNSIAETALVDSKSLVYASVYQKGDTAYIFYDDNGIISYNGGTGEDVFVGLDYAAVSIKDTTLRNHAVVFKKAYFGDYTIGTYEHHTIHDGLNNDYVGIIEYSGFLAGSATKKDKDNYLVTIALVDDFASKSDEHLRAQFTFDKDTYDKFSLIPLNTEFYIAGEITVHEDGYKYISTDYYVTSYPDIKGKNLLVNPTSVPTSLKFSMYVLDENNPQGRGIEHDLGDLTLDKSGSKYVLPSNLGISMQLNESRNNFGEAVRDTFVDFGNSAGLIFRGLAHLFTQDGWRDVGGIIAIGVSTTKILQENGFGLFLFYWGLISVNLGIVNLLPFSGLDGWHLLVIAVEGIFRKEIPAKIKNIVAAAGIILLFTLMILILIKDIVGLI